MAPFTDKLKERWKVKNTFQVIMILIVFACTGTTVALIAKPFLHSVFSPEETPVWANILYYLLILPVYNVLLLFFGLIFGQFRFFWNFEKRFFSRILRIKNDHEA